MSVTRMGLVRPSAIALYLVLLFSIAGFADDTRGNLAWADDDSSQPLVFQTTAHRAGDVALSAASTSDNGVNVDVDVAPLLTSSELIDASEWLDSSDAALTAGDGGCDPCDDKLFGFIAHGDTCFSDFISPITNPLFFEDPRTLTEIRFMFHSQRIPGTALGGGRAQVYAAQIRMALNDEWSIIATKDGYMNIETAAVDENGWNDVTLGLKRNVIHDHSLGQLFSYGLTYEVPLGTRRVLQGSSDGEFHVFMSGGQRIGCRAHWISGAGLRLPVNTTDRSQMAYWSNHFDYEICDGFYVLTEFNWYHWTRSGHNAATSGLEGLDLINLGSTGVAGNDIVTGAVGIKWLRRENREFGVSFEVPLTRRRDILDNRLTLDYIVRY